MSECSNPDCHKPIAEPHPELPLCSECKVGVFRMGPAIVQLQDGRAFVKLKGGEIIWVNGSRGKSNELLDRPQRRSEENQG
jgi:hypothetical protein